ncbi:MAG: hypothetical protein NC543_08045 [bacterium]|nr:hypothetical protein [bacterium]MCM1373530.1 hypothetical protein [Muribaculum sp.]
MKDKAHSKYVVIPKILKEYASRESPVSITEIVRRAKEMGYKGGGKYEHNTI